MTIGSVENFKGCILGRPPLVVFVTCLGLFAVILMSLAYYVKLAEKIPDPDVEVSLLSHSSYILRFLC